MRLKSNRGSFTQDKFALIKQFWKKMKCIIFEKMSRKWQTCKYCDVILYCCLSIRDRESCDINKQTNKQPSRCFIILVTSKPRSMISSHGAVSLNFDLTPYTAYSSMDTNNSNIQACLVIMKSTAHKMERGLLCKSANWLEFKKKIKSIFLWEKIQKVEFV